MICQKCVKAFVIPSERCVTCDSKCKPDKEIINLKQGGSSFSAHSEVEAKKYRPALVV